MLQTKFLALLLCLIAMPLIAQDDVDVDELMEEAAVHLQSQEFAKAADVFAKVVKADPENGRAWHLYGYSLHGAGQLDKAIPAHKKATEFEQFKGISLYNLGCAYSLKEDNDAAIRFLNQAVKAGYKDLENYESDPDLNNVRKDDRFKMIIARIKGKQVKEGMDSDKKGPSLAGTWLMKSGTRAGQQSTNMPNSIKVTKETFTIPTPDPSQQFVMAYELDRSKTPMHIDFEIKSGPVPNGNAMGIVKIEKGKMTLCYDSLGQTRPDDFKSTEENGYFLFVMQRKPLSAKSLIGGWDFVAGVRNGEELPKERMGDAGVQIDNKTITIPAGPDMTFVMKYEINNETLPVEIDMEMTSGPSPEAAKAVGIVRMQKGNLLICYDPTGQNRPKKFKSEKDDGLMLFTLKRQAKKKKAPKAEKSDADKADK